MFRFAISMDFLPKTGKSKATPHHSARWFPGRFSGGKGAKTQKYFVYFQFLCSTVVLCASSDKNVPKSIGGTIARRCRGIAPEAPDILSVPGAGCLLPISCFPGGEPSAFPFCAFLPRGPVSVLSKAAVSGSAAKLQNDPTTKISRANRWLRPCGTFSRSPPPIVFFYFTFSWHGCQVQVAAVRSIGPQLFPVLAAIHVFIPFRLSMGSQNLRFRQVKKYCCQSQAIAVGNHNLGGRRLALSEPAGEVSFRFSSITYLWESLISAICSSGDKRLFRHSLYALPLKAVKNFFADAPQGIEKYTKMVYIKTCKVKTTFLQ